MNQQKISKKRTLENEDGFNSSDDEILCRILDFLERKRQKLHHVEKCFVCQICEKKYKHKQSLNNHLQTHVSRFSGHIGINIKEISPHIRYDARKKIFFLSATSVTSISKQLRI